MQGWYPDIPNDVYHQGEHKPRLGSSLVKEAIRTLAHYKCAYDNPKAPSHALEVSSAFHSLMSGDIDEIVVMPKFDKRTKAGKAGFEQFTAENEGKYRVSQSEYDCLHGMADSISHHRYARKLVESKTAQFEISGFFNDVGTDLPCKIRPDILDTEMDVISDYKAVIDCNWDDFSKKIYSYGFHYSAAWYRYGYQTIEGHDCDFIIIAVEKTPPFGVNTFLMSGRGITIAQQKIASVLGPLADAIKNNVWPCYPQVLREPDLPGWIKYD